MHRSGTAEAVPSPSVQVTGAQTWKDSKNRSKHRYAWVATNRG